MITCVELGVSPICEVCDGKALHDKMICWVQYTKDSLDGFNQTLPPEYYIRVSVKYPYIFHYLGVAIKHYYPQYEKLYRTISLLG
jgi:hypothetical protein